VITGASTGIGRATALRLDAAGFRVYAGVRRERDGAALVARASDRLRPLIVDVTDVEGLHAAAREVESDVGGRGLDGLFGNAGVSASAPLELTPPERFRELLDVNLVGQLAVTRALLPLLRQARGRIVYTSSVSARLAPQTLGAYAASKRGLEAMAESLRREVRPFGVSVSVVEPGAVATALWAKEAREREERREQDRAGPYGALVERAAAMAERGERGAIAPLAVAEAVERALTCRRPKRRYAVGRDAKLLVTAAALMPAAVTERMVERWLMR
jgi:NAD(P)-dependent dehydrogenase (short-subunit alcohol dehydrogenase family)